MEQQVSLHDVTRGELDEVAATGKVWFKQFTFGKPMQPISMSTQKGDLIIKTEES